MTEVTAFNCAVTFFNVFEARGEML